ncbi:DUF5658 family protein [Aquisphaera insulae]|uniref:DUF5658 family protein n=1 Tax=Aquisphaera insulae TaxID=2712864 RepID=UPI0013EC5E0D|nr:DUF5658 family protein [Aquisphaera insulae]
MEIPEQARAKNRGRVRHPILDDARVQRPAVALLLLSAGDLFMTYRLLQTSPAFYESNPVAKWFFTRWNMAGMVLFKFAAVAFAIVACEIVERKRPGLGKLVLILSCLATVYAIQTGVNLYPGGLRALAGLE